MQVFNSLSTKHCKPLSEALISVWSFCPFKNRALFSTQRFPRSLKVNLVSFLFEVRRDDYEFGREFDEQTYATIYRMHRSQTLEDGLVGLSRLFPVVNSLILLLLLSHFKSAAKKMRQFFSHKTAGLVTRR